MIVIVSCIMLVLHASYARLKPIPRTVAEISDNSRSNADIRDRRINSTTSRGDFKQRSRKRLSAPVDKVVRNSTFHWKRSRGWKKSSTILPTFKIDSELPGYPEICGLLLERTAGTKGELRRFEKFHAVDTHKFDIRVGEGHGIEDKHYLAYDGKNNYIITII